MPEEDPFKLDYRDGAADLKPARMSAVAFIGGLVCGVIGAVVIGFVVAAASNVPSLAGARGNAPLWPAVIGFGVAAVVGLVGAIYFLHRARRRMFLAGFLLGIMLMSMLESTCFYQG